MSGPTFLAPKRLPNPPDTIRNYDPVALNYFKQLIRDIEISFQDSIGVRNSLNNISTSINAYIIQAVASLVVVDGLLENRISNVSTLNTITQNQVTSLGFRIQQVSALLPFSAIISQDGQSRLITQTSVFVRAKHGAE